MRLRLRLLRLAHTARLHRVIDFVGRTFYRGTLGCDLRGTLLSRMPVLVCVSMASESLTVVDLLLAAKKLLPSSVSELKSVATCPTYNHNGSDRPVHQVLRYYHRHKPDRWNGAEGCYHRQEQHLCIRYAPDVIALTPCS